MLIRFVLIGFALVALFLTAFVWQAQRRWHMATIERLERLQSPAGASAPSVYGELELAGLPEPVARYFRTTLRAGQPIVKRARVTWQGEFNMGKPGSDNWKPFSAVQEFVPGAPGFVWDARVAMGPGLTAFVRDSFVDGAGAMLAKVMGLITVADSHDTPEIAVAALQRYLGEAVWLPTALLPSQGVKWEAIDATRARATIIARGVTAALEFRFGADGLIESAYAPERVFDDGKNPPTPRPWQARNLRFGEFNGMKVPMESTVEWLFPAGAYSYWRGQPVTIAYEFLTATDLIKESADDRGK